MPNPSFQRPVFVTVLVLSLALTGAACGKKTTTTSTTNTVTNSATNATTNTAAAASDPVGTILVEAGEGTLSGVEESSIDYIKESARGLEAYLGSKGATASYTVSAETAGTYSLAVKLSDDGTWKSGYRDANITVNGNAVLTYRHVSEDTRGWKWYTVGNASLKVGENTVTFTKANDWPAAYVMDEFKFTPVILTP